MHPRDFMKAWGVSVAEMALLLNCDGQIVRQWLTKGASRKNPNPYVRRLLRVIHARFLQWRMDDEQMSPHYRDLYEAIRDRGFPKSIPELLELEDDEPDPKE